MTKKQLALGKAGFSLAIILIYIAYLVFFFTYGQAAFQRAANKMSEEQAFGGLGPAVGLMFAIIAVIAFAAPTLLFLIACIGNFVGKGKKMIAFTVVSLVAEVLAAAVLFFLSLFAMDGTLYDLGMVLVTGLFDLLVVASFIHSIIVLAMQKKALDE